MVIEVGDTVRVIRPPGNPSRRGDRRSGARAGIQFAPDSPRRRHCAPRHGSSLLPESAVVRSTGRGSFRRGPGTSNRPNPAAHGRSLTRPDRAGQRLARRSPSQDLLDRGHRRLVDSLELRAGFIPGPSGEEMAAGHARSRFRLHSLEVEVNLTARSGGEDRPSSINAPPVDKSRISASLIARTAPQSSRVRRCRAPRQRSGSGQVHVCRHGNDPISSSLRRRRGARLQFLISVVTFSRPAEIFAARGRFRVLDAVTAGAAAVRERLSARVVPKEFHGSLRRPLRVRVTAGVDDLNDGPSPRTDSGCTRARRARRPRSRN